MVYTMMGHCQQLMILQSCYLRNKFRYIIRNTDFNFRDVKKQMLKVNRQKENNVLFVNQLVVLTLSMILEDCWFLPKFEKMEIA